MTIQEAIDRNWEESARRRISSCDVVIVICGEHTDTATGVAKEVAIAQEKNVSYFLLWGRSDKTCVKPKTAKSTDKIYEWTWDNLRGLINGNR